MKSGYLKMFNVTRSITRGLTRKFLLKYVVLGLISNKISQAEHEYFYIYSLLTLLSYRNKQQP